MWGPLPPLEIRGRQVIYTVNRGPTLRKKERKRKERKKERSPSCSSCVDMSPGTLPCPQGRQTTPHKPAIKSEAYTVQAPLGVGGGQHRGAECVCGRERERPPAPGYRGPLPRRRTGTSWTSFTISSSGWRTVSPLDVPLETLGRTDLLGFQMNEPSTVCFERGGRDYFVNKRKMMSVADLQRSQMSALKSQLWSQRSLVTKLLSFILITSCI